MGPIEQLVQERLPPDRAEAVQRVRAGLPAPPGGDRRRRRPRRRGAVPRGPGRLRARGLARRRADGGAGLQPDPRRARLRAGRLGPRDQHRGPALPRGLRQRRARGPRPGHRARAAPDRRHRARARRRHRPRSCIPAARRRPSRSCTSSSTGAWRPRSSPTSRTPCARCWPTCAASCATSPPLRERVEPCHRGRRARAPRATTATRWPRSSPSCEWLARDNFIFLGARDYELRDGALRVVAGLRPGPARRRGALDLRQAGGGRVARPQPARARAGRRAAAGLQDEPPLAGAPPRAHGLRRHPPGLATTARSSARRA